MIKKLPLPITGVALGLAGLGNLLQSYSENLRYLCGILSVLFLLLFFIKCIFYKEELVKDLKNPVTAGIAAAVPMTIILLSTYLVKFIGGSAVILWITGIALHISMIIFFTVRFVRKPKISNVYASYFIVYVGIVTASVTAPVFGALKTGRMIWEVGIVLWIAVLIPVSYRYMKVKNIQEPLQPLFCIFAAPAGLCLAGYVQAFPEKSLILLYVLMAAAAFFYVITLIRVPGYLKNGFYPSFAAFTFPFVIQAVGMKQANVYLMKTGQGNAFLGVIVNVETIIACILVGYTVYCFLRMILRSNQ